MSSTEVARDGETVEPAADPATEPDEVATPDEDENATPDTETDGDDGA